MCRTKRSGRRILMPLLIFSLLASTAYAKEPAPKKINLQYELNRAHKLIQYNGLTRAAVHLERVAAHSPELYPDVHFTLAQIYEYKGQMDRAVILYHAYLALGDDEGLTKEAKAAIKRLEDPSWTPVTVDVRVDKATSSTIRVDGYIVAQGDQKSLTLKIAPSDKKHRIEVLARDHDRERFDVVITPQPLTIEANPVKKVFYGGIKVKADQPGVKISIVQEEAASIKAPKFTWDKYEDMKREQTVAEGVYFVTITHPKYQTWIRRVKIGAFDNKTVEAKLTRAKPPELLAGRK